ncbi:hypothetical protein C3B51_21630 [Pseudoalteromonas rubra]|uniref:Cadherin domain-containing protein n=1 Tax=Pseudoalteromonas rubra TaxID=43658 RepID=A0A4Q7DZP5_9GAMM|nr:hypothetical protein [Pseudoalteromonas rubra]RZM72698.1 hypothetical protein C3B51_21630 [Pseudoalteromonas rubra]
MRFLLCSLAVAVLAGCGGGSSESDNSSDQKINNNSAPVLVGEANWSISANTQSTKTFELNDKEGDAISVEAANTPAWLTLKHEDNALSLVANPSIFEVADYKIELTLSDATGSSKQTITIAVNEDPKFYPEENLTVSDQDLAGTWSSQSGDVLFYFGDDKQGLGHYQKDSFAFEWRNPDDIELITREVECIVHCSRQQLLPIEVVAKQDNKIAAKIHINEQEFDFVTLEKGDVKSLDYEYYSEDLLADDFYVSKLYTDKDKTSVVSGFLTVGYQDYLQQVSFYHSAKYDGEHYDVQSESPNVQNSDRPLVLMFENADTKELVSIQFEPQVTGAKIVAAKGDFVAMEYTYQFKMIQFPGMVTVSQDDVGRYPGLSDVLAPRTTHKIYRGIELIDLPAVAQGDIIFGLNPMLGANLSSGGSFYAVNTLMEITSGTSAVYNVTDRISGEQHSVDVSLRSNGRRLTYESSNYARTVEHARLYDGRHAFVSGFLDESEVPLYTARISGFPEQGEYTQNDYMKTFYVENVRLNNKLRHAVLEPQEDGRAIIYTGGLFGPNGRWQYEADNSMSFITPCYAETYAECLSAAGEKHVMNFKLLYKQQEGYWFMREHTHYRQDSNNEWNSRIYHNLQFMRLCDGVCYYTSN